MKEFQHHAAAAVLAFLCIFCFLFVQYSKANRHQVETLERQYEELSVKHEELSQKVTKLDEILFAVIQMIGAGRQQ